MLQGTLYNIIETIRTDSGCKCWLKLHSECNIYQGHFPNNPITPGVIMIAIAREIIELQLNNSLELIAAPSIKYISVLSPIQHPEIEYNIEYSFEESQCKAKVVISNNDVQFTRMTLVFKPV